MVIKYIALGLIGTGLRRTISLVLKSSIWVYRGLHKGTVKAARAGASSGPITGFGERMSTFEARHILGVTAESTPTEIKQAHARLILLHHPDKGGSAYVTRKINEAKSQLLN